MAIYQSLHLGHGRGVISAVQQAEQVENTATILIGLGGTGVDCLRTIKTEVYHRLRPDDPFAADKAYRHIRFLGVDSDEYILRRDRYNERDSDERLRLDETEFFSISHSNAKGAMAGPGVANRRDLTWLRHEEIKIMAPDLHAAGAGGIRQVGRFMLMDKANEFMSALEQVINSAKEGLTGDHVTVNIHIFTGIGGGTGSGIFLDVCYILRALCAEIPDARLFGYVFLPDVNLNKVGVENEMIRSYIRKNGYAALQELDYCMRLPHNGGSFEQEYKGERVIPWNAPPVDMCHLVCATNAAGDVIPNAYDYAMHVTAEHLVEFLTKRDSFSLDSRLAGFTAAGKAIAIKVFGYYLGYSTLGASCARLPLREFNTYLASELFEKCSRVGSNTPTQADVEQLAFNAMAPGQQQIGAIYNALWQEICNGASDGCNPFEDDWKNVINNDEAMVQFYLGQSEVKRSLLEAGARAMADARNEKSLFGRMKHYLEGVIGDISRGPIFAYRMLGAGQTNNLLNIIDGLIEENKQRWDQEAFQDRYSEYLEARDRFHNRKKKDIFETDKKRFEEYRYRVEKLEQHKFWLEAFERMDKVLNIFRDQAASAADTYYIKLARVMQTLIETFAENRAILRDPDAMQSTDAFAEPLVTVQELQKTLDAEVEKIHVPGMFQAFMGVFLDPNNEDKWLREDESEIAKLVTDFFVIRAFLDFGDRSITSFLRDKYRTTTDAELASKVYDDWMVKLTNKASPLFCFNPAIWDIRLTSNDAFLLFPGISGPVGGAANRMHQVNDLWKPTPSTLTDRIIAMRSACALPLCSYRNLQSYAQEYYSYAGVGRHLYEGKPVKGMLFDDWRRLPALTPQSLIDMANVPDQLREQVEAARALYQRAAEAGLITEDNLLRAPEDTAMETLREKAAAAMELAANGRRPDQREEAKAMREELAQALEALPMRLTGDAMPNDGYIPSADARLLMQEDYFVSSPVYQMKVEKVLDALDALKAKVAEADAALETFLETCDS